MIDHFCSGTVVDGDDVMSGSDEEKEEEYQYQNVKSSKEGDDEDDENYPKDESSSANMVGTTAPSSRSYIFHLIYVQKIYRRISKLRDKRKMVPR